MTAPRAVVIAIQVWAFNCMCVVVNNIALFQHQPIVGMNWGIINSTVVWANQTTVGGIGLFGIIIDFINIFNLFLQLVFGPFILVPSILDIFSITGVIRTIIIAMIWIPWAIFLFGMVTGRALREYL